MERMPVAQAESGEQGENLLAEFALDAGLKGATFPKEGTAAYAKLWNTCKEYSKEVHLEMVNREVNPSESQSRRRMLHNQLCIMIFGLDHSAVEAKDPKDLKRIANLAHYVSGREQYIEKV